MFVMHPQLMPDLMHCDSRGCTTRTKIHPVCGLPIIMPHPRKTSVRSVRHNNSIVTDLDFFVIVSRRGRESKQILLWNNALISVLIKILFTNANKIRYISPIFATVCARHCLETVGANVVQPNLDHFQTWYLSAFYLIFQLESIEYNSYFQICTVLLVVLLFIFALIMIMIVPLKESIYSVTITNGDFLSYTRTQQNSCTCCRSCSTALRKAVFASLRRFPWKQYLMRVFPSESVCHRRSCASQWCSCVFWITPSGTSICCDRKTYFIFEKSFTSKNESKNWQQM